MWEKPLVDGSAIMVFNRGTESVNTEVLLSDLGDSMQSTFFVRDLWAHQDLGIVSGSLKVTLPAHGVKFLKMTPPPPPVGDCPSGWEQHVAGVWSNPTPCGVYPVPDSCVERDNENNTAELCVHKCASTPGCQAFEVFPSTSSNQCWLFVGEVKQPFVPNPAS